MNECCTKKQVYRPRIGRSKLGLTISEISRELRTVFDARFKVHGVSNARWIVLWALQEIGEPTSQKQLAHLVGIESPTLVRILDRLEEDELVKRVPSVEDRRVKLVELCEKADPLLDEMCMTCLGIEKELFADIPEEDIIRTHEVLLVIRDAVFAMSGKTREDIIDSDLLE